MRRCGQLGLDRLKLHPGSHLGQITVEECLDRAAESINIALEQTGSVTAVIENTAGQGSNAGFDFGHLAYIIDRVEDKSRVGYCIDTCHAFCSRVRPLVPPRLATHVRAARPDGSNEIPEEGMHLNDAIKPLGSRGMPHAVGSRYDRARKRSARLRRFPFDGMPLILETPVEERYPAEIAMLYGFADGREY